MEIQSEIIETLKIRAHRAEAWRATEVKLKADSVDGHAACFEVLRHRINRVRFRIVCLGAVKVVEQFAIRVGGTRAFENFFEILRALTRVANAWSVVPDGAAQCAVAVERFVHHVPTEDAVAITPHHGVDVLKGY